MTTKDAPIPPIAAVINDAYHVALRGRYVSLVLTEVPDNLGSRLYRRVD